LIHHIIEHWFDSILCECWISHADNGFESTVENAILFFNVSELLLFDFNGFISFADSQVVHEEVSAEVANSETDFSSLIGFLAHV